MVHRFPVLVLSMLFGVAAACGPDEAAYMPLEIEPELVSSSTTSTDSFNVWGYTYDKDGRVESEGSTYTLTEVKWVNVGTDSMKREIHETDRSFGGGKVYNGGWVEIDANVDGSWYRVGRVEADLTMDHVFHLPAGAYAELEARADETKDCVFKYWRIDGAYSYDPLVIHNSGDGNHEHTVAFQCGSSTSSDEPPPEDCVDCMG